VLVPGEYDDYKSMGYNNCLHNGQTKVKGTYKGQCKRSLRLYMPKDKEHSEEGID